jgi:anti-sigma factor RsiW
MSHMDDGTLHAYLDGELSPADAQGIDAHLAQCPACRGRLEEERALITRAGELLALAAPPDRELPPFRAGDVRPPTRLWWQVRLPLAWAATVALALGIGSYLGRGVEPVPQAQTASDAEPARLQAREAPISSDLAQRESRVKVRGSAGMPPAAQPAASAPAARRETDGFAQERKAEVAAIPRDTALSAAAPAPPPAPQAAFVMVDGALVEKGTTISLDSARRLLGADPFVVPGAPIRAIHRAREIGYSAVVIIEQALDSSTVIEVLNRRPSPLKLDEIVVTGAGAVAARPDSASAAERARVGRTRVADSLAAAPAAKANARLLRRPGNLAIHISGPLPSDSLQKLLQLVQPVKP